MNGIGYRQTVDWLLDTSSEILGTKNQELRTLIDSISLASVQYAKRQRTRFRRYEKDAREHPKDRVIYLNITL